MKGIITILLLVICKFSLAQNDIQDSMIFTGDSGYSYSKWVKSNYWTIDSERVNNRGGFSLYKIPKTGDSITTMGVTSIDSLTSINGIIYNSDTDVYIMPLINIRTLPTLYSYFLRQTQIKYFGPAYIRIIYKKQ